MLVPVTTSHSHPVGSPTTAADDRPATGALDPVLVACAHGTRSAAGRRTMGLLRLQVQALRPSLEVWAAHVDVQSPALDQVVPRLREKGRHGVVVPLLLSSGFHVHHDVAEAVAASDGLLTAAPALGPAPELARLVAARATELEEKHGTCGAFVLAGAGSTSPGAQQDVVTQAAHVQDVLARPVVAGFLSAARPTVQEAIVAARAAAGGRPVVVLNYLLAPGFFDDKLSALAAQEDTVVTAPLGADPLVAAVALRRYDEALAGDGLLVGTMP